MEFSKISIRNLLPFNPFLDIISRNAQVILNLIFALGPLISH